MRSLRQLIQDNSPATKPEFWEQPGVSIKRRIRYWLNERLDEGWAARPFIASIGPQGLLLEVIPSEVIGKPITLFGVYELAVTQLLCAYLKAGDTFVDVGANLGYYSILAAQAVGPGGRVVAFEPNDRVRSRLQRNAALNGFAQLQIRSEAVGETSGIVRLVEPSGSGNDGLSYVDTAGSSTTGVEVRSVRLDAVLAQCPALIKVDVEGGEASVFAGARGLLERGDAPAILFESFKLKEDAEELHRHGYRIFQPRLHAGRIRLTDDLQQARYRRWEAPNYLAAKSDRALTFCEPLLAG